jgi:hypothetical protein
MVTSLATGFRRGKAIPEQVSLIAFHDTEYQPSIRING